MSLSDSAAEVVLEARLNDALSQRDRLLASIETWADAVDGADEDDIRQAEDELRYVAREVTEEVWGE